ncbi:MAG: hypothetical protein V4548_13105 [Bacteroidota bacterium]
MKNLLILFTFLFLISCKKETKFLKIVLTKNDKTDTTSIQFSYLSLKNLDSIYYKIQDFNHFKSQDTIKIDGLPTGDYKLEYLDIIGNLITKTIHLENNAEIKIIQDSINAEKFESKTAIANLKKDSFYTVKMETHTCFAVHGYYKINRIDNLYYIESYGMKNRLISQIEFDQIKKFESELLAINEKEKLSTSGRLTFEIITDSTKIIRYNARYWDGWGKLWKNLNK